MCRLAINIATFVQLMKRVDFDTILGHFALTHITRSKANLTTTTLKEVIKDIKFILIYYYTT